MVVAARCCSLEKVVVVHNHIHPAVVDRKHLEEAGEAVAVRKLVEEH